METQLKEQAIVSKAAVECLLETGYDTSHGTSLDFVEQLGPAVMSELLQPLENHGVECNAHGHVGVAVMHVDGPHARLWLFRLTRPRQLKHPTQKLSSLLFRGIDLHALMLAQKLGDVCMDEEGVIQAEEAASPSMNSKLCPPADEQSLPQVSVPSGEESPQALVGSDVSGRWI